MSVPEDQTGEVEIAVQDLPDNVKKVIIVLTPDNNAAVTVKGAEIEACVHPGNGVASVNRFTSQLSV